MDRQLIQTVVMGFWAVLVLFAYNNSYALTTTKPVVIKSQQERLSYTVGVDLGKNFSRQGIQLDYSAFLQGLKDAQGATQLQLTDKQMQATMQEFQQKLMNKRMKEFNSKADANKKVGEDFLAKNKLRQGIVSLPSGVQYRVLKNGKGNKPAANDTVTVEYTGRLINGTVFDSTDKAGQPAKFRVDRVIKGWTEVLQKMPIGSTWEVFIPSQLAYGSRGLGGPIGPNETLIFKIHLIAINTEKAKTNTAS